MSRWPGTAFQVAVSVQLVESDLHWPVMPQKGGLVIDGQTCHLEVPACGHLSLDYELPEDLPGPPLAGKDVGSVLCESQHVGKPRSQTLQSKARGRWEEPRESAQKQPAPRTRRIENTFSPCLTYLDLVRAGCHPGTSLWTASLVLLVAEWTKRA